MIRPKYGPNGIVNNVSQPTSRYLVVQLHEEKSQLIEERRLLPEG